MRRATLTFTPPLVFTLLLLPMIAIVGCTATSEKPAPQDGSPVAVDSTWPVSLEGIIDEPRLGRKPVAVRECGSYVIVSYDGVTEDEVSGYVSELSEDPRLFMAYSGRNHGISAAFSDVTGNTVTVAQMGDGSGGDGTAPMSLTVVLAGRMD